MLISGVTLTGTYVVDTLPSAVTANLVMSLDAGVTSSYPGSGTAWTDTVGGKVFTLAGTIGAPTYSSSNGGYINFTASGGHHGTATSFASILSTYTV